MPAARCAGIEGMELCSATAALSRFCNRVRQGLACTNVDYCAAV